MSLRMVMDVIGHATEPMMLAKYHIRSCVALPCGAVGQVHFHAVNFAPEL
jgi:hypothetical protein